MFLQFHKVVMFFGAESAKNRGFLSLQSILFKIFARSLREHNVKESYSFSAICTFEKKIKRFHKKIKLYYYKETVGLKN